MMKYYIKSSGKLPRYTIILMLHNFLLFAFRESCRGVQLRDIMKYLRIEDKLNSTEIAKIIPLAHFNENFESIQYLSCALSNVILNKNK